MKTKATFVGVIFVGVLLMLMPTISAVRYTTIVEKVREIFFEELQPVQEPNMRRRYFLVITACFIYWAILIAFFALIN